MQRVSYTDTRYRAGAVRLVVSPCNSRRRGTRQERLFHNLPSLPDCSTLLPRSRHSDLKCLIRCVHGALFVDTNTVSTKAIILTHTVEVHTVGSGQVRTLTYDP